jgi:hypothetical protein
MKLNIRGKLFAVSFGLIALSLLAGEFYLRPAIEGNLIERIRTDLFVRLGLIVRAAEASRPTVLAGTRSPTSWRRPPRRG